MSNSGQSSDTYYVITHNDIPTYTSLKSRQRTYLSKKGSQLIWTSTYTRAMKLRSYITAKKMLDSFIVSKLLDYKICKMSYNKDVD